MRIGVIGNSHLAAFKLGWEVVKSDYPSIELTFFGSPATSMRLLTVENGAIRPKNEMVAENLRWTSGGLDYISSAFDAYICVGMGFSFVHLVTLLRAHRLSCDYDPENEDQQLISEGFLQRAMEGTLWKSDAAQVIQQVKQISKEPIYYAPNPFGSAEVLQSPEYDYFALEKTRNRAFDFYRKSLQEMPPKWGVTVFPQPEETVVERMFTKPEYSKGSIKLKRGMKSAHKGDDFFHMNSDFGVVSLREILNVISRQA